MSDLAPVRSDRVRAAIDRLHRDLGATGLDSPTAVDGVLDDGPARALVKAAASAGVAAGLNARLAVTTPEAAAREIAAATLPDGVEPDDYRWVVAEYARVLGHPVPVADEADSVDNSDGPGGAEVAADASDEAAADSFADAQPTVPIEARYRGRAAARAQPNRGRVLDDTSDFDVRAGMPPEAYAPQRRRIAAPVLAGAAIAIVIAAAVTIIVNLSTSTHCQGSTCRSAAIVSRSVASPTPTPPAPTKAAAANVPPLAAVMPADVDLPKCRTTDEDPFLDDVVAYYACQAGADATLPYLQVWGYQFADQAAYSRGIDAFNGFVKFDPAAAEGKCPPAATYGRVSWHTLNAPDVDSGTLECYSDSSENHYYVWTDDAEYTIIVAESGPEQAFGQLDEWWRQNNRNA
ncbi:MAG TPA: hypothetical protein VH442_02940 [Micromonosporaceae bacterium]